MEIKMERKEAIALAREGENFRQMARYNQNESRDSISNMLKKAEECFKRATDKDTTYVWAWAHWGATLSYKGGITDLSSNDKLDYYQQADSIFERATNKSQGGNENYAWAWAHRGENSCWLSLLSMAYREKFPEARKNLENAELYLKKATSIDENYTWAYARMGVLYRLLGHLEGEDGSGEGTQKQPNYDLAVENFSKAIKLNTNYSWAYVYRAVVHRQKARALQDSGCHEEALKEWNLTYNDIEYSLREYVNVFKRPLLLQLGHLYPCPNKSINGFDESPFQEYANLVLRVYEEGYEALKKEEIDSVLANIAKEWASVDK